MDSKGVCIGCGRTIQEIMHWRDYTPEQRDEINRRLLAEQETAASERG